RLRQVDARGFHRPARRGVHADAAGVAEQIEETPTLCQLSHARTQRAVIEKQTGIEVIVQVDEELQSALTYLQKLAAFVQPAVLFAALATPALLERDMFARNTQRLARRTHQLAPTRAREVLVDACRCRVFLDV